MPKVSVIVPFYNVENYIEKCLKSLVNQTLQDIQIILVNDGSKDNSMKIAKQFEREFPDKILYLEKENGGLSDARNYGILYATGEYIAFLDSDDYVELNLYETMYQKAKEENSDLVECDFIWEYSDRSRIDIGKIYQNKKEMILKARVVAWNKLIRRELIERTGICYTKNVHYEDVDFFYNMVPFYEIVSFVKQPLIHYIQREDSISNFQNERTKEIFIVLDNVIAYYKKQKIYEEYQEELEYVYIRDIFCSSLLRMVRIEDTKKKRQILKETWKKVNEIFPDWKKNQYLKTRSWKNSYMRMLNSFTYLIFCFLGNRKIVRKIVEKYFINS